MSHCEGHIILYVTHIILSGLVEQVLLHLMIAVVSQDEVKWGGTSMGIS